MASFYIITIEHSEGIYVFTVCQTLCYRFYLYPANHSRSLRHYLLLLCLAKYKLGWVPRSGGHGNAAELVFQPGMSEPEAGQLILCSQPAFMSVWETCSIVNGSYLFSKYLCSSGHSVTATTREGTPGKMPTVMTIKRLPSLLSSLWQALNTLCLL